LIAKVAGLERIKEIAKARGSDSKLILQKIPVTKALDIKQNTYVDEHYPEDAWYRKRDENTSEKY
jgi:hypothetical protein